MEPPTVWECPNCGKLWVGYRPHNALPGPVDAEAVISSAEHHELTGYLAHFVYAEDGRRSICRSIPETVQRNDVQAAFIIGGRQAAEACVNGALREAIQRYEREQRGL